MKARAPTKPPAVAPTHYDPGLGTSDMGSEVYIAISRCISHEGDLYGPPLRSL